MKKTMVYAHVLLAPLIGLFLWPPAAFSQDYVRGDSSSPRQHGYEHGYRDGYAAGRNSAPNGNPPSNRDLDQRNQQQRAAGNGYQPSFGSEQQYSEGYDQGLKDGLDDGRRGVQSRLEQLFRPVDPSLNPDRNRNGGLDGMDRGNRGDSQHLAADVGYRDGVNAGVGDRQNRRSYQPRKHVAWRNANHGYDPAAGGGQLLDYKRAYRDAYEAGYRDGFGANP